MLSNKKSDLRPRLPWFTLPLTAKKDSFSRILKSVVLVCVRFPELLSRNRNVPTNLLVFHCFHPQMRFHQSISLASPDEVIKIFAMQKSTGAIQIAPKVIWRNVNYAASEQCAHWMCELRNFVSDVGRLIQHLHWTWRAQIVCRLCGN